ncbi:hypothetical protein [Anaerorhabdus sp.]|uniref:hypothetical protein n=1 Tax=Anaerorhabdus sp. TaxID=1872524 RepID=UPI002FCA4FC4
MINMKKVKVGLTVLVIISMLFGCSPRTDNSIVVPSESPNVISTPAVDPTIKPTNIPDEDEKENSSVDNKLVQVDKNISYYDENGKRHYSLYDNQFKLSVNITLPSPLKLIGAKTIGEGESEYIELSVVYQPEGCKSDTCSNLFSGWAIYPNDFEDSVVQANKEYSLNSQNDYFAINIPVIDSVLDEVNSKKYYELIDKIDNGDLELIWWE